MTELQKLREKCKKLQNRISDLVCSPDYGETGASIKIVSQLVSELDNLEIQISNLMEQEKLI